MQTQSYHNHHNQQNHHIPCNGLESNFPINEARNRFLKELCVSIEDLEAKFVESGAEMPYAYLKIDTNDEKDHIKIDSNHIFSKKKFLCKKAFQYCLEEYFNSIDIYIEKPKIIAGICFIKLVRKKKSFKSQQ